MLARIVMILGLAGLAGCPARVEPRRPAALPSQAYAHYLRGRLALYRGDFAAAVTELHQANVAAPGEPRIAVALIEAIYATGDQRAARAAIAAAQQRWPDAAEVWIVAGNVHRGLEDHEHARVAYQRAIRLDRDDPRGWLGLAATWLALDKPKEAEATYRRLLEQVPDSVDGRFQLAERLLARAADDEAEPHLRKVLELDPDHIDGRLALARSLRRRGRLTDAVVETRQAFDRTGGDAEVAEELFWLLCEADDRQAALDLLGLLDDSSAAPGLRLGVADLYRQIGALDDAVRIADELRAEDPANTGARLVAAEARADRSSGSDVADALALVLAIPIAGDDGPAARALAVELLLATGDRDRALAVIEAARRERPDSIDLLATHAQVLHARGDTAAGRALLARALQNRRKNMSLRYALAAYEDAVGNPLRAAAEATKIVEVRADHVAALNLAGYALARAGHDLARAQRYLTRARALAPGDPSVLDSWGWLRYRQGHLAEAERALAHAARIAPQQTDIRDHLAEVRARVGHPGASRTAGH